MFLRITLFLFPITFGFLHAQDISPEAVRQSIPLEKLTHPFLLFNSADKEAMLLRVQTDPESRDIMNRLLAESNMLLYQPVDQEIPPRGSHVRAGWTETDRQNPYDRKIGRYREYARELAFVYQMTGEERYAQKAYEFAAVVCSMPLWTLQAHEFDIIYSRVWPWNVPDDQVNFNFDIGTATTAQIIAWVYDWTYPALDKPQRARLRNALLEKAITHVRGDYDLHWWATAYRCNWTGVCNAGVGMAALALLPEHPQLVDVVAESYNRINRMLNELGQDGGWQEGGSYWKYGMDRSILFAYAFKRASGGTYNLFLNERLAANPVACPVYLFVPPDKAVNFGDAHDHSIGGTDFFNLLTTETNSAEGAWYRQEILGPGNDLFDLVFPRPTITPQVPEFPSRHFRSIDWWVMRSNFTDPAKVTVAGKAGKNDDPHHGHLDIGHFILFWQGEDFLKDSGRPYYDEEYFDEARWSYPQAGSSGHNVVMVNGEQQLPGKRKDQPWNEDIGGEVLEFSSTTSRDYVLMDPTGAYPKKELHRWRRHISLDKATDAVLLLDEVEANSSGAKISVRFHSGVDVDLQDSLVLLHGKGGTMAMIPLCNDPWQIRSGRHAYQPVHATKPFEWLPYFDIEVQATGKKTKVATLILPVKGLEEALEIRRTLSWQYQGEVLHVTVGEDLEFLFRSN